MSGVLAPAAAALVVFAACLFGLSPTAYWLDSAELVAAAQTLGIPHPPGHPWYVLTAKAVALWPVGSITLRVNLASAVALAGSAAMGAALFARIGARVWQWRGLVSDALAAGVAVAVCFSFGAAFQGVRAEVYALHLATALVFVSLLVRLEDEAGSGPDLRWLFLAAGVAGLGLANHHLLMVLAGLPLAVYALWRLRRGISPRLLGVATCALLIGLAVYLFLPLRAERAQEVNWGSPNRAGRFGWVVSARAFQKSVRPRQDTSVADNALTLAGITMEALTPVGAVLGLFGLGWLVQRRRALGLALLGAGLLTLVSQLLMPADPHNPDVHGYLLLWMMFLAGGAFWALAGLAAALPDKARPWAAGIASALALALPATQLAAHAGRWSLAGFDAAEAIGTQALRQLPPTAVFWTSYFKGIFVFWHQRVVAGARPDVALVHRNFLRYPGYASLQAARYPELAGLFRAYAERSRFPSHERAVLGAGRPVRLEFDLNLQDDLAPVIVPAGWSWRIDPLATEESALSVQDRFWGRAYLRHAARLFEPETRRYFLWTHFLGAVAAQRRGWRRLAHSEARRGLILSPGSPELRALLGPVPAPGGNHR